MLCNTTLPYTQVACKQGGAVFEVSCMIIQCHGNKLKVAIIQKNLNTT